jgi:hypothetical protein
VHGALLRFAVPAAGTMLLLLLAQLLGLVRACGLQCRHEAVAVWLVVEAEAEHHLRS